MLNLKNLPNFKICSNNFHLFFQISEDFLIFIFFGPGNPALQLQEEEKQLIKKRSVKKTWLKNNGFFDLETTFARFQISRDARSN